MVHHPREQRVGPSVGRSEEEKGIWAIHVPFVRRTRGGGGCSEGTGGSDDDGADDDDDEDRRRDDDAIPKAAQRPL